jgi:hypothetical protein
MSEESTAFLKKKKQETFIDSGAWALWGPGTKSNQNFFASFFSKKEVLALGT